MGDADMTVVHGEWCETKTWPTSCPSCSAQVFYFSCDHGLRRFTDDNGDTVVELKPGITVTRSFAKPASFKVEQSIISEAQPAKRMKAPDPIVPVEPERELAESH